MFYHHLDLYFVQLEILVTNFLVPKLSSITFNEFTVKDSFAFDEKIVHQGRKPFMAASMLTDSLLICLQKKPLIYVPIRFDRVILEGIKFKNLPSLATQKLYLIFNDVFYKQKDGMAMGSPLGPTMTNVFLLYYEVKQLEQIPKELKPAFYRRYVDDIFVLFKLAENLPTFRDYFNTSHGNMNFSFEQEKNEKLSFHDVEVSRVIKKFVTTVYRKPTLVACTHIFKILPTVYKFGMVYTLAYRCFEVCSDQTKFDEELSFVDKLFIKLPQFKAVEKKIWFLLLP